MCVSACLVPVRRESVPGVSRPDAALAPLPSPRPRTPVRSCHLLPGESTARTAAAGAATTSPGPFTRKDNEHTHSTAEWFLPSR